MERNGFSLIELLTIVAIVGILVAISALGFKSMTAKSGMESQTKQMYADLMTARSQALYRKRERAVIVTSNQFSGYSSAWTAVSPVVRNTLKYPVTASPTGTFRFSTQGVASAALAICLEPSGNGAVTDSIVISTTSVRMGKRSTGGDCDSAHIVLQ